MAPRSKRIQVAEELHPGEATPSTEEVVVEISDDDLDGLVIETAPQEPEPAPEPEPGEPNPDEAVRRAVEAQQRAEQMARDAQRERDEAVRRERERSDELRRERDDRQDAQYNGILTSIAAEQATLERAEQEYAAALEAGRYVDAAKAQTAMAKATARIDRLEDNKATFDDQRASKKDDPAPTAAPTPSVEQQINSMQLPEAAKTWLRSHPDMLSDPAQSRRVTAAHQYLTEIKGVAAFTQPYFDALEVELGIKKPAPAAPDPAPQATPPQPRRSMPMTAPVSRDVPTSSGQRQTSSITLTPEQVQIARTSFTDPTGKMTNADKERAYALNLLKLQRMRANGSYPNREQA